MTKLLPLLGILSTLSLAPALARGEERSLAEEIKLLETKSQRLAEDVSRKLRILAEASDARQELVSQMLVKAISAFEADYDSARLDKLVSDQEQYLAAAGILNAELKGKLQSELTQQKSHLATVKSDFANQKTRVQNLEKQCSQWALEYDFIREIDPAEAQKFLRAEMTAKGIPLAAPKRNAETTTAKTAAKEALNPPIDQQPLIKSGSLDMTAAELPKPTVETRKKYSLAISITEDLFIRDVEAGLGRKLGLQPGDTLLSLNQTNLASPHDLPRLLDFSSSQSQLEATVWRYGQYVNLRTELP
jgi:hypothetical protein